MKSIDLTITIDIIQYSNSIQIFSLNQNFIFSIEKILIKQFMIDFFRLQYNIFLNICFSFSPIGKKKLIIRNFRIQKIRKKYFRFKKTKIITEIISEILQNYSTKKSFLSIIIILSNYRTKNLSKKLSDIILIRIWKMK